MDVKVTVENVGENGTVTLSRTQPRVGLSVKASLTDPDGGISGLTWQWYQSESLSVVSLPPTECADDNTNDCVIEGAMSDTHTPTEGDETKFLTAVAMYTDGQGAMKSAVGKADKMRWRRTPGTSRRRSWTRTPRWMVCRTNQRREWLRRTPRRLPALPTMTPPTPTSNLTDNVGSPIMAEDPDPNADPLIYTLSGARCGCVPGQGQRSDRSGGRDEAGL